MGFIPTHCDHCQRAALHDIVQVRDGNSACSDCARPMRIVPAATFKAADLTLYSQLSAGIRLAGIAPASAARLVDELRTGRISSPEDVLPRVARVAPAVTAAFLAVERDPPERQRLETMLAAILQGIATARR